VDWAVGLMVAFDRRGLTGVEPRRDAAQAWTEHVNEARSDAVSQGPIVVVLGGEHRRQEARVHAIRRRFGNYRKYLDATAQNGYSGLVLTTR
jgi:arginase family enzyme